MSDSPRRQPEQLRARFFRYSASGQSVHLTGLEALARLPLEQIRRDRAAGRRVGGFISGYPGSPLAGFDQILARISPLLDEHDLHFQLGLNEELAAAAVAGSQLVDLFPHSRYDGVIGMWFGKAPGVDRCLDVLRHSNFAGISRFGGAVAVAGDDPACKSSSLPSQSEHAFAHAMIPLLVPAGAGEVIELGLHAYALSRYAGVWTGLKLVADVCDGGELIALPGQERPLPILPRFTPLLSREIGAAPFEKHLDPRLLPPHVLEIEGQLVFERLEAVQEYIRANTLDQTRHAADGDRLGLVACGKHYRDLLAAFDHLGIGEAELEALGIRLRKLAVAYPLEARGMREFADGLETIVVLDDRRDFLEQQVCTALYELPRHPRVLGQRDADGAPWLSRNGALSSEGLARDIGPFLAASFDRPELARRAALLNGSTQISPLALAQRRPHFCSGCPHLTSTQVPDGLAAAGGIGCHTMVLLTGGEMRFFGAMGSEGAAWMGLSPFVDTPHLFQNLGDGTYFHSGRQAIRACVASDVPITFKLLYNGAIAMTGGQRATGEKPLAAVIGDLLSDGVRKVVACSSDSDVLALAREDRRVEVIQRDAVDEAQRALADEPGVSVFVYDEMCANERQRQQKRGLMPAPGRRVFINQDICEGCGDCGRRSACLSVHPIDTILGRKTTIHQGSCSQDETCTKGDCPAFFSLEGDASLDRLRPADPLDPPGEEPELPAFEDVYNVLMIGVGSTGVVTVDAILVDAARRDGLYAVHLDQTGLSQRGGRVVSHLRLARRPFEASATVPWAGADSLLAFDPLGAAEPQALTYLSPERTRAVLHESVSPTADMVSDSTLRVPSLAELRDRIGSRVQSLCTVPSEELCTALLGTHLGANLLMLGFAFQRGTIPVSSQSIEAAITERGVASEANLAAFRLGRAFAAQPHRIAPILREARPPSIGELGSPDDARALYGERWTTIETMLRALSGDEEPDPLAPDLLTRLAGWSVDLCSYQNRRLGERYLDVLTCVLQAELSQHAREPRLTSVAARELYRLNAYKDEYEVARLSLHAPFRRWLRRRTGGKARPTLWLHPPMLRAMGLSRKLHFGPRFEPLLRLLAALRGLRGTGFDPFGRAQVRRLERELIPWYEALLERLCSQLEAIGVETACAIADEASKIRGYEDIKLRAAAVVRERVAKQLAELES